MVSIIIAKNIQSPKWVYSTENTSSLYITSNLIEVTRTKALPQHMRLNFEAIENPSSSSFDIAFFQFTPLGRQTFHFIQRNNIWRVSGADCSSLYMNEDAGDEAVGDSSYDISINYLSGIST